MPKVIKMNLSKPIISVCIPTKNRENSIGNMLKSLCKQSFKQFEVIIVDGGSTDQTLSIVKKFQTKLNLRIVNQPGGLISQMNKGLSLSHGSIFVRTDDDVVATEDWLKTIESVFHSNPKIGGVTGPTVIPAKYSKSRDLFYFQRKLESGNILWKLIGKFYYSYLLENKQMHVSQWLKSGAFTLGTNFSYSRKEPFQEITNLEACNWSVRTSLLKKIGGFDTTYSGIGEYHEPDASLKIRSLGYKLVFHPKAEVNHCPSIDGFFQDRPKSYPRMVNFVTFYLRHIKANTIDKKIRFISYLIFQNLYYTFQAINKKQPELLGSYLGTIVGLLKSGK